MGMEIGAILFEITRIIGFLRTLLIRHEMENSFACRCRTGIAAFITLIDLEIAVFSSGVTHPYRLHSVDLSSVVSSVLL